MIPYTTFPDLGIDGLYTYGLMLSLGVVIGAFVGQRILHHRGYSNTGFYDYATWLVIAGLAGARLLWAVSHIDRVIADPLLVFRVWEGGLSFVGGVLAAAPGTGWRRV